jgi:hypothetical protein
MKKKYIFILLIFLSAYCGTSKKDTPWEGIQNNILRVAIYEFHPEDEDAALYRERVHMAGNSRGALILVSHASLNIERSRVTPVTDAILNRVITEIIDNGKIFSIDCRESGYCLAIMEYNMAGLTAALQEINN